MSPDEWFNRILADYKAGRLPTGRLLDLGTSPHLPIGGWLEAKVLIEQKVLKKFIEKHRLDTDLLKNFPSRLRSPEMVFQSKTCGFVVVTDLVIEGRVMVAAYHHQANANTGAYNAVPTIHLRDPQNFVWWEKDGLLRYKKKNLGEARKDTAPCNSEAVCEPINLGSAPQ